MKFRILTVDELNGWYLSEQFGGEFKPKTNLGIYQYTDFCHLTGAIYHYNYYKEGSNYMNDICMAPNFWLDSDATTIYCPWRETNEERGDKGSFVSAYTQTNSLNSKSPYVGVRPILTISEALENGAIMLENGNILYGEYLQDIVEDEFASRCTDVLNSGKQIKTGKKYTVNGNTYDEYLIDGRKVSLVKCEIEDALSIMRFSNGKNYFNQSAWVEAKPVEWIPINDSEAISMHVLFPSIYNVKSHCIFEESVLYRNINKIFASELIPSNGVPLEALSKDKLISMYKELLDICFNLEQKNAIMVRQFSDLFQEVYSNNLDNVNNFAKISDICDKAKALTKKYTGNSKC